MNVLGIILIDIHILLCIFTFLGTHFGFLHVHKYMFFVVLCLPFWGFAAVMFCHWRLVYNSNSRIYYMLHYSNIILLWRRNSNDPHDSSRGLYHNEKQSQVA